MIARSDEPGRRLAEFAGRVVVVNEPSSQSGCNVLRVMVESLASKGDFFGAWKVSGAHRRSIEMVRTGAADIAAVDCVTLAGLLRQRPACWPVCA